MTVEVIRLANKLKCFDCSARFWNGYLSRYECDPTQSEVRSLQNHRRTPPKCNPVIAEQEKPEDPTINALKDIIRNAHR